MNELIKISKNNIINKHVINARDLQEFLGAKQDFSWWIKGRIEKYRFIENVDYVRICFNIFGEEVLFSKLSDNVSRTYKIEYAITLDMAKELAMVQNNERGRQVRQYFIEAERGYRINRFSNYLNRMFLVPCIKSIQLFKTYFIRDKYTGYIKIGKSINVDKRIKNFRTINPTIELVGVIDSDVELELHREYEHKRQTGEWFNLNNVDVENIKLNIK